MKRGRISGLLMFLRIALACLRALDLTCLHAAGADLRLAHMTLCITNGDLLDVGLEHSVAHAV